MVAKGIKATFSPSNVRGAANFVKAAGKSIKPVVSKVAPVAAKLLGKATNKSTIKAVGTALRNLSSGATKTSRAVLGGVASAIVSPVAALVERKIDGKPLFSKPALFQYAFSAAKGVISGAITGAIIGSVVPGPGTAVGFVVGLLIGVGVGFAVDKVVEGTGVESNLKAKLNIGDD